MSRAVLCLSLLLAAGFLQAQSSDYGPVRQERYSLVTLAKYCDSVESLSNSQVPRVFAQLFSNAGAASGWTEFSSKAAWRSAGRPQPLAMVWYNSDRVVRVAIMSDDGSAEAQPYADYCYRPDGGLARIRAVPELQTACDPFVFHCSLRLRPERMYPPRGQLATLSGRPMKPAVCVSPRCSAEDPESVFRRALQSEQTSLSFAPMDWPEYLNVRDLPFNRLLDVSVK
jgi:hypothetical protein